MINIIETEIPEVKIVEPKRFGDHRGFFQQCYHADEYRAAGVPSVFVQDNWSRSRRGILRGLHFQLKHPQAKLVSVVRGAVFDVAVDIRKDSPTFGRWVGAELTEENGRQLYVPEGFAHGFCVLSEEVDFFYKCSDFYHPEDDYGVRWDDPAIGIDWPLDGEPVLSEKDRQQPLLADAPVLPLYAG